MEPRPRLLATSLALLVAVSPASAAPSSCEPPKTQGDHAWAARVSAALAGLRSSGAPGKARLEAAEDECAGEGRAFKVTRGGESQLLTRVQYRHLTQRREVEPEILAKLARLLEVPAVAAGEPAVAVDPGRKAKIGDVKSLLSNPFGERADPGAAAADATPARRRVTANALPDADARAGLTTKKVPAPSSPAEQASGSIGGIIGGLAMVGLGAVALTAGAASLPVLAVGAVLVVGGLYVAGTNYRDFYGMSFGKLGDIFGGIGK